MNQITQVGIVVIGRNEGQVLRSSLKSALAEANTVVYVDSSSTDNSLEIATELKVEIVKLDPTRPFTAARGYNAGAKSLWELNNTLQFVQFLDGDAQFVKGWVQSAYQTMIDNPDASVVCGYRREKYPEQSIYNFFADMLWDTPISIGEVKECGPESMMRLAQFQEVGGFNECLMTGEEPEICLRLRQQGGKVLRIAVNSSQHDMNMHNFQQWWQRSRRGGYGTAEEFWLHRQEVGQYRVRKCLQIWLWAFILPMIGIILIFIKISLSILLISIVYGGNFVRVCYNAVQERQYSFSKALIYGIFCSLIKFPEWHGQVEFFLLKLLQRGRLPIEYKSS